MPANIRDEITAARRARVARLGFDEGAPLPETREAPITPFLARNGLICEVKRKSPSKGDIAPGLNAVAQAKLYLDSGAANLSVLTVPEGFGGSLKDLVAVKKAFPEAAVLRKDFLFAPQDVDAAHRAGADAVLLIAGMLTAETLEAMYKRAKTLGLTALVELHDAEDVAKAAPFRPEVVGINSRDLTTFTIDPLLPLRVRAGITWPCTVVYESGIQSAEQAAFAASAGFGGILVGEGVVRRPALAGEILAAMQNAQSARTARPSRFWTQIAEKRWRRPQRPIVKICGLTSAADAALAAELGADALGFVFYEKSPRCADPALLRELNNTAALEALKVAVVVTGGGRTIPPEVRELLDAGILDAVQLHGEETPDEVAAAAMTGTAAYKALRLRGTADAAETAAEIAKLKTFRCPRVLVDAAGSGQRIHEETLRTLKQTNAPLWIAGGITPTNVREIIADWQPELIDLASGVEERPGTKSPALLKKFFAEIKTL